MKPGDIVCFKRARAGLTSKPADSFQEFKGHGYGLLLGHIPRGIEGFPPLPLVLRQLGTFGFISFDDIIELAGRDTGDMIARKFGEKYYGKDAIVTPLVEQKESPIITLVRSDEEKTH